MANFVGNGWAAVINLVFIPLYLHYIGAEGYGLIGIFASLQVILSLLDNGLSTSLNKELAGLSVHVGKGQQMKNIVKTLGNAYWLIAIIAGAVAMLLAPFIARHWVQPEALSVQTITISFLLLGMSLIFQFPIGFYSGGLLGLQRQVMLNILKIFYATLKSAGALLVLIFISQTVIAFFSWILLVSILQAFTYRYFLQYYLPRTAQKAVFDKAELKKIWRFAAGMTAIGITSVLLTQTDKIILSKLLSLENFGYYTFAFAIGSVSYMIVTPVSQSYFPRLSMLYAKGEIAALKEIYHQSCSLVTLLVVPFALLLAFFSKEILFIWTHDEVLVDNTWLITSVVTIAAALHCLMFMPYMLCLTYNHTKLALYTNLFILIVLIPGVYFSAKYYGALGGATCWLCINSIYFFVNPWMIHKYFLQGEAWKWYWTDTIKPSILPLLLLVAIRYFSFNIILGDFYSIVMLAAAGIATFSLTLLSTKTFREPVLAKLKTFFVKGTK